MSNYCHLLYCNIFILMNILWKQYFEKLIKFMHTHISCMSFPCGSAGKESTCNMRDLGLIPGLGRSPGGGKGYPLQYSGLENMDCIVHWVAKSWTQLSDFHFHFSYIICIHVNHLCCLFFSFWLIEVRLW